MDARAEKLAKARKKLRDHQEKKVVYCPQENHHGLSLPEETSSHNEQFKAEAPGESFTIDSLSTNLQQKPEVNITEMLISDKTTLEMKINYLNNKVMQLEYLHESEINKNKNLDNELSTLRTNLNILSKKCSDANNENILKDRLIDELKHLNKNINDTNNDLLEQLEVTKTMLKTKETENSAHQNEIHQIHNQLESAKLQIQQLTNDTASQINHSSKKSLDIDAMAQKVSTLKQEINTLKKEREEINSHYEHYVKELNEQLRKALSKNDCYSDEVQKMYQRENSLIKQISDMEIRLQNFSNIRNNPVDQQTIDFMELEEKYLSAQGQLQEISKKYNEMQKQYQISLKEIQVLTEANKQTCDDDIISISKLNADITSDKLAAQMATEQNKKLKQDIEDLELVVVKMTRDKLELTEMLNHEKNLNKDLMLKLSEIEESTKNINNTLRAKDEEMIRLQTGYREIEKKHGKLLEDLDSVKEKTSSTRGNESNNNDHLPEPEELQPVAPAGISSSGNETDGMSLPKSDAMLKLQERFFKIMNEVANLSDEKHRLEHIILQLQVETDTICEYVALYQQQRSLLKKREEERYNQLTILQKECSLIKLHLEELRDNILHIIDDATLQSYFSNEDRRNDKVKIKHLLETICNSSLINAQFHKLDLNIFYPCNCCSGQLIDV